MKEHLEILISSLSESVLFTIACAAAALAGTLLDIPFQDGFGLVLLIVGAGLMLIGGALSFVTPAKVEVFNIFMTGIFKRNKMNMTRDDYRRSENRAALYSVTGVLLFAYSLLLAAVFV